MDAILTHTKIMVKCDKHDMLKTRHVDLELREKCYSTVASILYSR